jgi:hypothetical protein
MAILIYDDSIWQVLKEVRETLKVLLIEILLSVLNDLESVIPVHDNRVEDQTNNQKDEVIGHESRT